MDKLDLEKLLEEASCRGAEKALATLGLGDDEAIHDIRALRQLLDSYRDVKSSVLKTVIHFFTVAILGLIAAAVWWDK